MRLFAWLLTKLFGAPRRIGPEDAPLMLRWHLGRWFGRDYRVHHILRPDNGLDPHDHPYAFTSRVLKGWLAELVFDVASGRPIGVAVDGRGVTAQTHRLLVNGGWTQVERHLPFRRHSFPATHTHMITAVSRGGCWTLVSARASRLCHGACWERVWGFWTDSGFVTYDRYDGGDR